jgi:catechol 2,3-dioxygenase-like lactoylglutathione lyase family enzyme
VRANPCASEIKATRETQLKGTTMKRLHVHTTVPDLDESIRFYSTLFGQEPARREVDYAKWMLEDPRVNFAISTWGKEPGIDHLGFQVDDDSELTEIAARLENAGEFIVPEKGTSCCYAKSDKHWVVDPAGTPWETFRTMAQAKMRGSSSAKPEAAAAVGAESPGEGKPKTACCGGPAPAESNACCVADVKAKEAGKSGCGCGAPAQAKN